MAPKGQFVRSVPGPPAGERVLAFVNKLAANLPPFTAMRHSLAVRLLGRVLLFSVCVTLVLTLLQLYLGYRRDVSALELQLDQISRTNLDSLAERLWALDENQLRLQLTGILRLPDIRAVDVREARSGGDPLVITLGEKSASKAITREYPLLYKVRGQNKVVGTLYVQATLADIQRKLFITALTILLNQAAEIFLVSLFIVYIFHNLVTRHLFAIANFADSYRISDPSVPLRLRRSPRRYEDELQRVVTAFNALSDNLQVAYRSLHEINAQLTSDIAARRQAEAALREREARIRRLVDANIIGIFIWELEGRILEANDAFLRMVGYDREDLVSGRLRSDDLTPPEWRDRDAQLGPELKMTGRLQPFEKEYFRKHGGRVPVLIGIASFEESTNQGVAFVLDLTERKRSEEALRRSEAYLAEAQRLTKTGSWAHNAATGKANYWSEEMFRIVGLDPLQGPPAAETFLQRVHPEDRDSMIEVLRKAVLEKMEYEDHHRLLLPDGTVKYIHRIGHPVLDRAGEVIEYVGTEMDETERKRAEEALRRSEKQLRDLIETIPVMVFSIRPDGSTEFVSRSGEDYLGLPLEGITGAGWQATIHPDDVDTHRGKWLASLASGQPFENEVRHRSASGEYRWFLVRAVPLRDEQGNILKWYGVLTDIEDRRRAETEREKLRQLQADLAHINRVSTLGELSVSLSHELKQPITAAITNANTCLRWLMRDEPHVQRARDAVTRIVQDGKRAAEIIDHLRSFYKKGAPPERVLVDVNEVIMEMLGLLRSEANRYSISMHTELAAELPKVTADRIQLQQVFMNLMLNGIEAMKDTGGELSVTSKLGPDSYLLISVSDTGVGLPTEKIDEIFSAFFTTKPQGSGMGLAISRSIVESHGGHVWANANAGPGATFHLTLPVEDTLFD